MQTQRCPARCFSKINLFIKTNRREVAKIYDADPLARFINLGIFGDEF
jgi:hypothetical protein